MSFQYNQSFEIPIRRSTVRFPPLQAQPASDHDPILAELRAEENGRATRPPSAAITRAVHDPAIMDLLIDLSDGWEFVGTPVRGISTQSNSTDTTATPSSVNGSPDINNGVNRQLTASSVQLFDAVNNKDREVPFEERLFQRSIAAEGHCASLKTLGCVSMSDSVESIDKIIHREPWVPARPFSPSFDLDGVGTQFFENIRNKQN